MKCPFCECENNRVLDTRVQKDGGIRRRRECLDCKSRFTTLEIILKCFPHVIKKDGRREPFDKDKLRRGLQLACMKRDVSLPTIEGIVDRICHKALEYQDNEMSYMQIGHWVMEELRRIDDVAYVRFASVYKTFKDIQEFVKTLESDVPPGPTV
ncbi:MAG: transcriptional repressor NrdR [Bdellovibrionaceae bacterium]|nr:transcriptional repressor NrdR [Pseudobdellovibrionaceae bacterium]